MRRDQLEHAIRTACQIIGRPEVIVVGSQAILGTYSEGDLPVSATMSMEIDILPIADNEDEITRLADLVEGVAGQFSPFEEMHGFSIDGEAGGSGNGAPGVRVLSGRPATSGQRKTPGQPPPRSQAIPWHQVVSTAAYVVEAHVNQFPTRRW